MSAFLATLPLSAKIFALVMLVAFFWLGYEVLFGYNYPNDDEDDYT